jgi:predicted Zn-dependent protease
MKMFRYLFLGFIITSMFSSCKKDEGLNIFSVKQDMEFGQQMDSMIMANPSDYPVLDKQEYPGAYLHLDRIKDAILDSDDLNYDDKFVWKARIIEDDEMLNAFATPGGYLYFYTGLIKYLDNESQFAGVMAHEICHADKRHSTETMTKVYGASILLNVLLGKDPSKLAEIAADLALGLGSLKFSRNHEYEADEYAVRYTYDTSYDPKGVAGFFIKLEDENAAGGSPEFLSTHPDPGNRVEEIIQHWENLGSRVLDEEIEQTHIDNYKDFKNSLPE